MKTEESGGEQAGTSEQDRVVPAAAQQPLVDPPHAIACGENAQSGEQKGRTPNGAATRIVARVGVPRLVWQFVFPAITGALTLLLIFVQTRIYLTQTEIFGEQLTEMRKATEAATEGLRSTREMARLDQRAWVAVSDITGALEAGQPLIVTVHFKNTGKTFARNAQIVAELQVVNKGDAPNFERLGQNQDRPGSRRSGVVIVPPNGGYQFATEPLYDGQVFDELQIEHLKSSFSIFVIGRITYADVFDRDHSTEFCASYNFEQSGQFNYCDTHNVADNRSGD